MRVDHDEINRDIALCPHRSQRRWKKAGRIQRGNNHAQVHGQKPENAGRSPKQVEASRKPASSSGASASGGWHI
jgi:hypothetical protein